MTGANGYANWAADRHVLIFSGLRIQGFADGTFLRMRAKSDGFTSKVGSDGLVSHSRTNDHRKELAFILEDASSSNDSLSAIHQLDLAAPNGAGVGNLLIQDLNGTTVCEADICRIMRHSDQEWARETGTREWTLEAIVLPGKMVIGGR